MMRGYLWTGEAMVVARGLSASAHEHSAVQLCVGIEAPVRVRADGAAPIEAGAAIVAPDVRHEFSCAALHVVLWIESQGARGRALVGGVLAGEPARALPEGALRRAAASLETELEAPADCARARAVFEALAGELVGSLGAGQVEPRVARAVRALRVSLPDVPPIETVADDCQLSPRRLRELFREQIGVPVARYVLWLRVQEAIRILVGGGSATDAAHAAGFSDSAHLSRSLRRMTGISPRDLFPSDAVEGVVCRW